MSRQFSIPTVLRMVPNELLARIFYPPGLGDLDIKWNELGEREPEPIIKEISQLSRSEQDAIEGALRSVCDLACESGIDAIFEAALKAGDLDLPQAIPHDVGPYAKAMTEKVSGLFSILNKRDLTLFSLPVDRLVRHGTRNVPMAGKRVGAIGGPRSTRRARRY